MIGNFGMGNKCNIEMKFTETDRPVNTDLIEQIIIKVEKYQNIKDVDLTSLVDYDKEIIVVVGDAKYPLRTKGVAINNVAPFSIYQSNNFSEVAFLCDKKTLELFSIIGVFFDSIDKAAMLINELLNKKLMDSFAKYLFFEHNVMLVNANGTTKDIDNLLGLFKNHKVLFCWGKKKGYGIKFLTNLNKTKTNKKYDRFIRLNHPSSKSYIRGFENTCSCYLDRTYKEKMSNLSIQDFKIF